MSRLFKAVRQFVSKVKCRICGGWGGEWGDAQGVGHMCYNCWVKGGYKTD